VILLPSRLSIGRLPMSVLPLANVQVDPDV
jgi:hypothetical protein